MSATVKGNVAVSEAQRAVQHGVVRAVGVIGAATLASRVLGFVRDMVVARAFGASPVTDAFFVAFRIPNLLRRLLAEGALSTAIIPVFTEYLERAGRAEFGRMVRAVTGVAIVVLCVVSGSPAPSSCSSSCLSWRGWACHSVHRPSGRIRPSG